MRTATGLLLGRADPDSNETGRAQAAAVAVAARSARSQSPIVSSPLRADDGDRSAIGEQLKHPVEIDDRLIELDYGEWDGEPLADVPLDAWAGLARRPLLRATRGREPGHAASAHESVRTGAARAQPAMV